MAFITVSSSSELANAMSVAKGGDTIRLAGGNYGDFAVHAKLFSSDVTITSLDSGNPATFHSIDIRGSGNISFQGVNVDLVPTATTTSFSSAVHIENSSGVTFANGVVKGGAAITGVPITATETDSTSNVIGLPTGRGFTIQNSEDVRIEGTDISELFRAIVMGDSANVTISGNDIHDLRKGAIVGNASDLVIEGNYLHDVNPWRIGEATGDHATFIALWTNPNQDGPTENVTIRDNILSQGDGHRILGMWLQGGKAGYENALIEGNAILGGDHQGIVLWDTTTAKVVDNVLLQTTSYEKSPGILLSSGTNGVIVSNNVTWSTADQYKGTTGNKILDNILVNKIGGSGYYDQALIDKVLALSDPDAIYALVVDSVASGIVAPPVVVPPPGGGLGGAVGGGLIGSSASDTIMGTSGDDVIDGKGGVDKLVGGQGNDTYIVPSSASSIVESAGGGVDTVIARGNYVLGSNLENLVISDTATNGWSGTGNELNNVITGNGGFNLLDGGAGSDTIDGRDGNDVIVGGVGDDRLTGGAGVDTFRFARGSGDDVVTDFGVGGRDAIDISAYLKAGLKASVQDVNQNTVISFTSGDSITLVGVASKHLVATSNGFVYDVANAPGVPEKPPVIPEPVAGKTFIGGSAADTISGTSGDDIIDGKGGVDKLVGGQGNDTYIVPNSASSIVESAGGGVDTVIARGNYVLGSNLENLVISDTATNGWSGTGNELNNVITGNGGFNFLDGGAGNDTIDGRIGNDVIVGGIGDDRLTGGAGVDTFRFALNSGDDVITDFGAGGRDVIDVSAYLKAGIKVTVQDVGDDTVISLGSENSITLVGIDAQHLSSNAAGFVYS